MCASPSPRWEEQDHREGPLTFSELDLKTHTIFVKSALANDQIQIYSSGTGRVSAQAVVNCLESFPLGLAVIFPDSSANFDRTQHFASSQPHQFVISRIDRDPFIQQNIPILGFPGLAEAASEDG